MKKTLVAVLVVGVIAATLAGTAEAKKKKKPKPVATTLYLHGAEDFGEMESFLPVAHAGVYLPMDPVEPEGSQAKSKMITNYSVGPNPQCAGNNLFPVWTGKVTGTIVGDLKFTFNAASTPGKVTIRVWPDIVESMCNDSYPAAAGEVVGVALPAGQGTVEATVPVAAGSFPVGSILMIQISPTAEDIAGQRPGTNIFLGRIFYDSQDAMSALTFNCLPPAGATSCVPAE